MMNKRQVKAVNVNRNRDLLKNALNNFCKTGSEKYTWAYVAGVLQTQLEIQAAKDDGNTLDVLNTLNYLKQKVGT